MDTSCHIDRRQALGALGGGVATLAGCLGSADGGGQSTTETDATTGTDPSTTEGEGTESSTIVVFRNDDPAPWTDVEVLSTVNEIFIRNDVPLTQGVVPYDSNEDVSLAEDDVCQHLRSLNEDHGELFENALHGYTHSRETDDFYWGSEFGGLPYEKQRQMITKAVEKFEECLGEPSTFVAPFNTYDETTVRVLSENGFDVVSGSYYFQKENFGKEGVWKDDGIVHAPTNLAMEDSDTQEVREIGALKSEFDENKAAYGLNIVMLHYQRYTGESERQTLEEMIQYAKDDGSTFMTLQEFVDKWANGGVTRTEDVWRVTANQ